MAQESPGPWGHYDPVVLRARARTYRTLARSWTELAAERPFVSAGRLRRSASAALFAAHQIDEIVSGSIPAEDYPALVPVMAQLRVACARSQAAVDMARSLASFLEDRVRRGNALRAGDLLRAQLLARKKLLRACEATIEWLPRGEIAQLDRVS